MGGANAGNVKSFFGKYSSDGKKIEGEEIEALLKDLGVEMEDPVTLTLSYHMEAKAQGVYTFEEFSKGCTKLNVDSLEKMKK